MEIKPEAEKQESEFQKALSNLLHTSNWLRDQQESLYKPFGISARQYEVLQLLHEFHPDFCTAGQIKAGLPDKNPDLTRLMDRLQKKELIQRDPQPGNRRKMKIGITEKAIRLLEQLEPGRLDQEAGLEKLTRTEAIVLNRILDKLRN